MELTKLKYTLKHKVAFLKIEKKLLGRNTLRGIFHDMDKVFMYIFTNKSPLEVQKIHRSKSRHHVNNLSKTKADYIQMVIDWECARYTKPDKPLNAYHSLYKFYPELEGKILPILKELNLIKN